MDTGGAPVAAPLEKENEGIERITDLQGLHRDLMGFYRIVKGFNGCV
jgi:hypothetical protein